MRILDQYLLRQFALPLVYCLGAFWLMAVLYDLFGEHLNDFIEWGMGLGQIARYYLLTAPGFWAMTMPLAMLLALLYSLSILSKHHELNAMRASGQSLVRAAAPLLVVGLLASAAVWAVNEGIAAHATAAARRLLEDARLRAALAQSSAENTPQASQRSRHEYELNVRVASTRRYWRARAFNTHSYEMRDVEVSQESADGSHDEMKITARTARWLDHEWWFFDGVVFDYTRAQASVPARTAFRELRREDFQEDPKFFLAELGQVGLKEMTVAELRDYLRRHPEKTQNKLAPYQTQLHERFAHPLACFVVVLLGVPLGARFSRRGPLMATATAVGLILLFWLTRHIITPFGEMGRIEPWLAAWLPYGIFAAVGTALLARLE